MPFHCAHQSSTYLAPLRGRKLFPLRARSWPCWGSGGGQHAGRGYIPFRCRCMVFSYRGPLFCLRRGGRAWWCGSTVPPTGKDSSSVPASPACSWRGAIFVVLFVRAGPIFGRRNMFCGIPWFFVDFHLLCDIVPTARLLFVSFQRTL